MLIHSTDDAVWIFQWKAGVPRILDVPAAGFSRCPWGSGSGNA